MAILAKRCSINREFARSSLGRLPASFGGLLGFLLVGFEVLRVLFGRSEQSAESRLGLLWVLPRCEAPWGRVRCRRGAPLRGPLGPSPLSARSALVKILILASVGVSEPTLLVYTSSEIGALVRRSGIRTNTTRFPFLLSQVYVGRFFACCRLSFRRVRLGRIAKPVNTEQHRPEVLHV